MLSGRIVETSTTQPSKPEPSSSGMPCDAHHVIRNGMAPHTRRLVLVHHVILFMHRVVEEAVLERSGGEGEEVGGCC